MESQEEEFDWEGAKRYWEYWIENFEKHIYPIFYRAGISKNTAMQVYALACDPSSVELDDPPEEWQKKDD